MKAPIPLVIDCDPGVDDAWCLALALASPEVDVRAVTTVAGNSPVDVTTRNAGAVLAACGRSDIPVAAGATRGLVHSYGHSLPLPHGENGLGGAAAAPSTVPPVAQHAVYLLRDVLASAAPRSVTVVAIAPLTNIALLASLHPELLGRIDRIVVMGGSASRGNITPVAEFNVWTDPESAQRVLCQPDLDILVVGLDVTRRATVTRRHVDAIRKQSPLGELLAEMVEGYQDNTEGGWAIHDALTLAAVIDPAVVRTSRALIEVDTGTGATRGQTICEFADAKDVRIVGKGRYAAAGQVSIAVDLDVERFRALLVDRVAGRPAGTPEGAGL
jgi:pyrimidine-specific ribonucleoside hydrolase